MAFVFLPSSPPTALGGAAFFLLINQKQVTHGTQSMGFEAIHQPKFKQCFDSVKFRVNPWLIFCFLAHPSLTHPALKDMLLLFSLHLAFTLVYDNAHGEWAYLALRIFSRSWLDGHPPENLGYLRPKVRLLEKEVFLQRLQLFP